MKILIKTIIITRVHGNKRHTPRHAITHNDTEKIVSFIKNFAETHGILLPGRVPGVRDYEKAKLLPSSMSKRYVYSMYKESCDGRVVSESSFKTAWKLYVPHIYIMKPMTDLCWTCRKNSRAVVRTTGSAVERISEVINNLQLIIKLENHLH